MEAGAERRIVTVLFADLVGFTALSESLDPEDVAVVQTAYFDGVRETIARYGGSLEKFIGDAVMAVFGVPRAYDDDAERAVRAGLALVAAVEQLAARVGLEAELDLRVGINGGEVLQGDRRHGDEALVTGDAVNVAARLQGVARPGEVVVGETTALAAAEAVELEEQDAVELKGKREPVRVWRVAGLRPERSRERAMGRLRAPLLGREAELVTLEALVAAASSERVRATIVAPPGVGKTRLLAELAARLAAPTWVARVRPDLLAPYDAVRSLLTQALGDGDGSDLAARLVARGLNEARADAIAADVGAVMRPGDSPPADAGADRELLFASWIEALDGLAGDGVAVWVVEDVHWAGADLLGFLSAGGSVPGRRLVLTTARPSILDTAPSWVDAGAAIHLAPLEQASAADLVRALVGDALGDELTGRVAVASDGNPLFIEELLRSWVSAGTLAAAAQGWRLTRAVAEISLPYTVQAIYGGQLDDLPAPARLVARRASVAGRTFPLGGIRDLAPEADSGVQTLSVRALVSAAPADPLLGPSVAYRHALLRDAGYASLSRAERAALHVRYADWLDATAAGSEGQVAELIGRHLERAISETPALAREVAPGLDREEARRHAAAWFERGAEAAMEVAAHETARALLRHSLELTPADAPLDEARRRRRLGEVTAQHADMDEGARELERAIAAYEPHVASGDDGRDGFSRAVGALGWVRNQQVRFDLAADLAERGLATLGPGDDAAAARLLLLRAVATNHGADDDDAALRDAEAALGAARRLGEAELEIEALKAVAQIRGTLEDWEALTGAAVERRRWADAADAARTQAAFLIGVDRIAADQALAGALELCQARGLTEARAWTEYMRAEHGALYGDWDESFAAGRRAHELGRENAYHRVVLRTWSALLPLAAARRDRAFGEEAREWIERFEPPATASLYALMLTAARDLHVADACGTAASVPGVEERLAAFELGSGLPSWYSGLERILRAWLDAGEVASAAEAVERLRRGLLTDGDSPPFAFAVAELLSARVRVAEGDGAGAAEAGRRAVETFTAAGAVWWQAKALRLLERVGAGGPREVGRAVEIERALGITAPA